MGRDNEFSEMKWLLIFLIPTLLVGQTVIPNGAPASYVFDGRIDEWKALEPTFVLHSTTGGRKARVWVRQVREGLLIAGEVLGIPPDFPSEESEMLNKDHVEIWLAPENPPKFPKVGWENMEGSVTVGKRQDCIDYVKQWMPGSESSCDEWLAEVAAHRPQVARLFVREFGLSPNVEVEAYAKPAWEHIAHEHMNLDREWGPLDPKELPLFKAEPFDGGYGFESVVPWAAMPPLTSLDLKALRLMVDVFSAHKGAAKNQPFSTSSPVRRYGYPSTMNLVKLAQGRKFRITACEYPLEELDWSIQSTVPASFRPGLADEIMRAMILVNEYSHRGFTASGESPALVSVDHWQQPLTGSSTTVTACGPRLALHDSNGTHRLLFDGDKVALSALAQPDGGYLVRSGPTATQDFVKADLDPCFACRIVDLYIVWIGPRGEPRTLLELHEAAGSKAQLLDRDIQVNQDWSKVTIYRETSRESSVWESETLCRLGFAYKPCGKVANSPPPPLPRTVVVPLVPN
jgi:hypothetical protein